MYRTSRRIKGIRSFLEDRFIVWFQSAIVDTMLPSQRRRGAHHRNENVANAAPFDLVAQNPLHVAASIPSFVSLPFMKRNAPIIPELKSSGIVKTGPIRKKDRLERISEEAVKTSNKTKRRKNSSVAVKACPSAESTVLLDSKAEDSGQEPAGAHNDVQEEQRLTVFCLYSSAYGRYLCPKCYLSLKSIYGLDSHIKHCRVPMEESIRTKSSFSPIAVPKKPSVSKRFRKDALATPRNSPVPVNLTAYHKDEFVVPTPPNSSQRPIHNSEQQDALVNLPLSL